ncbi:MAG: bis(5'-nucleosyl)-tetraphosphatase (symmetrical) YqeK [Clostridia bacterium]
MDNSIKEEVLSKITPKKVNHTLGVIKAARELAIKWDGNVEDAENAALIHDITKHLNEKEQLNLCEKYGIIVDNIEKNSYKLLHAKTAAEIAKNEYNMNDEVYRAIKYHTTLHRSMTLIEKIVYLADYIEENRTFDGVQKARKLAYVDINEALRYCLDSTIIEIMEKGNLLHLDTIEARNYLYEQK